MSQLSKPLSSIVLGWVLHGFARLPLWLAHALGTVVGQLIWWIPNDLRRVTLINLGWCFPASSRHWRRQVARRSLTETAKAAFESPYLWRQSPTRIRALLCEQVGNVPPDSALRNKRYVLASPHLGSWEYAGLYAATVCRMTTLYRPPRQAALERPLRQARARTGAFLVPTDRAGLRQLFQRLDTGGCLGILPDQTPRRGHGVFAPFFGHPANTTVLIQRLVRRYRCPIYLTFAERLPAGRGYRLHWHQVDDRVYGDDPVQAATALNAAIEWQIRRCPSQYNWSYKRFKQQPDPQQSNPYRRRR